MNSIIKMFGPSISEPSKIVNRDVPACDELAYRAVGYKRGSLPEVVVECPVEVQPEPETKPETEEVKAPKAKAPKKVVSK